jgi:phage tail-like protein
MAAAKRIDPFMSFRFRIEIDGLIQGGFTEISGLEATTQVEDFREGGLNDYIHKLPKETTFTNLILKKGLADSDELYRWHRDVLAGKIERTTIHITMLKDRSDEIAHQWSFKDAFPAKWKGPDFNADGNTVAFEILEIAHHGYV